MRFHTTSALAALAACWIAGGAANAWADGSARGGAEASLASSLAERAGAVSGPIISISPLAVDFGLVSIGQTGTQQLLVTNSGDEPLQISAITLTGSSEITYAPSTVFPIDVAPSGGVAQVAVQFTPTQGLEVITNLTFLSNAVNGAYSIEARGRGNTAPVLSFENPPPDAPNHYSAYAYVQLHFDVLASDAEGDYVTLSASGLPPGASFDLISGHFAWVPDPVDAGAHEVDFCATDGGATACATIRVDVTATNTPPVADPGGPYQAGTGQPVQFDGSRSSDPDGDALGYAWNFGDGAAGSGVAPTHAYASAGEFLVILTVSDHGSPNLTDTGLTSATILNTIPVEVMFKTSGGRVRVYGSGTEQVAIQNPQQDLTSFDAGTMQLSAAAGCAVSAIRSNAKGSQLGDLNHDGATDLSVFFDRSALGDLLGCLPNNSQVNVLLTGLTTAATGRVPVQGMATITVGTHGAGSVRAFASPNPFNPETVISYSLRTGGVVSIRIYSLQGRLVRTLLEGYAAEGTNEIRWDGRDNGGAPVPSGLYFVKVQEGADSEIFKITVAK